MNIKALLWLLEYIERTGEHIGSYKFIYEELTISLNNVLEYAYQHYVESQTTIL